MANYDPKIDRNQYPTLGVISGTNGPTYGTSAIVPLTATENGYLNVNAAVTASNTPGGTLDLLKAGTITKLEGGTLGLVTTVSNLSAGSVAVTAGTVIVTNGTIGAGTVAISAGTVGGKAASGAAAVANPVLTAGTDAGGTIYAPLMTTTGHQLIDVLSGTIQSAGTVTGVGVVTSVTNLAAGTVTRVEQGSINITAGTIGGKAASGAAASQNPVFTAGTDAGGTIYGILVDTKGQQFISAGTITNSGTTTGVGTVSGVAVVTSLSAGTITKLEGGTLGILSQGSINVTAGTVGGKAASGAAAVANPVLVAGTDAGGTVYALLTDTKGQQYINSGTITRVEQGSIKVTAGTVIVTAGTIAAGTVAVSAGTITHGTIDAGTVRVNSIPTVHTQVFGTTTTGTIGTLVAAPSAGSAILIDSLDVSVNSGTAEVLVSYGLAATGNGVISRGLYPVGGGISKNPTNSIGGSTTGSALTYNILSGSGTVSYSVAYKIAIP